MQNSTIFTGISIDDFKELIAETVRNEIQNFQPIKEQPEEEKPMKVGEVAKLLKVSEVTIHDWKKKGLIPFHRISRKVYFYKSEVLEALKKIEKRKV